jgi:hypothetical protein
MNFTQTMVVNLTLKTRDNNALHTEPRAARFFLLASRSPRPGERCRYPIYTMKYLPSLACVAIVACLLLWHGYSPLLSIVGSVATLAVFSSHVWLHPVIEKLAARSTSPPGWSLHTRLYLVPE